MNFSSLVTSRGSHVATVTRRLVGSGRATAVTKSYVTRSFGSHVVSSSWSSIAKDNLQRKTVDKSPTTSSQLSFWSSSSESITEDKVRGMFTTWNDALQTLDSSKVASLYSKTSPYLLPTVSDTPRTDYASLVDYFNAFLKSKPNGKIISGKITVGKDWAMDCGVYEFTLGAVNKKVMARYTFVYKFEDGNWCIAHHHSSQMPEGIVTAQPITKAEVQSLFNVWNDALATLDSKTVAALYSKNPCLLPTVSDTPRTDNSSIVDYFNNFLKLKPQGVITESYVTIGTNWAQDAGIYEFTLGANGAKVKARYSFIYVYEDGQWKINHHHSSVLPEGIPPAAQPITEAEVRSLFDLWNQAAATLDPAAVAKRFSKNGVLLPTVSNIPRTDPKSITAYFADFLQKKPQGKVVSGNIIIGHNWAQDAGIYEFTMGIDGSKVKARYTFVYVYEDGEWKIANQHSSLLPEGQDK